jgi:protein-S-isoprenylcysteine O-methyltransferase Ste14
MIGIIVTVAIEVVAFGVSYYYLENKQKNINKQMEETTKQQDKLKEHAVVLAQLGAVLTAFKTHFDKAIDLAKENYIVLLGGAIFFAALILFLNRKTARKHARSVSLAMLAAVVCLPVAAVHFYPKEFGFVREAPQEALKSLKTAVIKNSS